MSLHALIVVFDAPVAPAGVSAAREALEDQGWETLVLCHSARISAQVPRDLVARWIDCDLAVLVDAPDSLVERLQRHERRPVLSITHLRRGDARLVG